MRAPRPSVSVVIPVHGEQPDLGDQLAALGAQAYVGWWEVIVGDNGCGPGTLAEVERQSLLLPHLRVVDARDRPGANHARNVAVAASSADLIAICDSDDVVAPGWIDALVAAAADAELVGGHVDVARLNPPLVQAWRPSPTRDGLPDGGGFLPYVVGANCAVWRDVYTAVGGCDEEVGGGGGGDDVELSWRIQLAGGRIAFAPSAVVHYRLRPDLASLTRQMFTYGISSALTYRLYRRWGATRMPAWLGLKTWVRTLQRGPQMLLTAGERGRWLGEAAYLAGRIWGGWRHRVWYW